MHVRFRRLIAGVGIALIGVGRLAADDLAGDIARIHVEAIGGAARLARLSSLRAAGQTRVGNDVLDFQMWAERPNRVRIEIEGAGHHLVQAWDGRNAPWLRAGEEGDAEVMEMNAVLKDLFVSDADFDDPLYHPADRGYTLDYAGEGQIEGGAVVKLRVVRSATDESVLYLAADTYFIVRQDRRRTDARGKITETQTYFSDFRPVLGVVLPHKITTTVGEQILSQVILNWIEPNPPADDGVYTKPKA